jgi:endonuclease/exonuclease/phosphatase (EEP) superfamily protein YafD
MVILLACSSCKIFSNRRSGEPQRILLAERTLDSLADAGYQNGFEELSLPQRVTHPSSHGFPDATFDFLFAKNLMGLQPSVTQTNTSDHWPVTREFRLR